MGETNSLVRLSTAAALTLSSMSYANADVGSTDNQYPTEDCALLTLVAPFDPNYAKSNELIEEWRERFQAQSGFDCEHGYIVGDARQFIGGDIGQSRNYILIPKVEGSQTRASQPSNSLEAALQSSTAIARALDAWIGAPNTQPYLDLGPLSNKLSSYTAVDLGPLSSGF